MKRNHIFCTLLLLLPLMACQQTNEAGSESNLPEESVELPPAEPIEKRLTYGDYQLIAKTTVMGEQTSLAIRGLVGDIPLSTSVNQKVERIADVEIADLDENGQPEVYAFDHSADGHYFGRILAFQFTPQATWSEIAVDELPENLKEEYQGHDQFRIESGKISRTFPIYRRNGKKTGKERTLTYTLITGTAGARLRVSD